MTMLAAALRGVVQTTHDDEYGLYARLIDDDLLAHETSHARQAH